MRLSRDAWILAALVAVSVIGFYIASQRAMSGVDSPSSYGTGKRGTKALYLLLEELHFRVARHSGSLEALPKDASVAFLVEPYALSDSDAKTLVRWVQKGNTLIYATSRTWGMPESFDILASSEVSWQEVSTPPVPGRYSRGVRRVRVEALVDVLEDSATRTIVKAGGKDVVVERKFGTGRIVFFGDSLMLANSMIREEDNVVLVTNIVYENVRKRGRVLFLEYEETAAERRKPVMAVIGRGGQLALANLALVILLVIVSASFRFGAIHPLAEKEERPRGWEFVRAMAGLYRRAGATGAAFGAVYRSFRRELLHAFGVQPAAPGDEAAEAVLRSRQVDRARLAAILHRCDRAAAEESLTESDALALVKNIEECRRELGIARSTDR